MTEMIGATAAAATANLVKDASIETFEADVLEASMTKPVIVDFWATWCGPCKTLGPMLEKAVKAAAGAVAMVKIDIDKNQMLASQMRIQSVPTVYAFFQGRPVDGFQGAIPESEIRKFIERLKGLAGGARDAGASIDDFLAAAEAALADGDAASAAAAFAEIAEATNDGPDGPDLRAMAGLAKAYLAMKEIEQARQIFEAIPEDKRGDPALAAVKAALALARPGAGAEAAALKAKVDAAPKDHQARFDYAEALIGAGDMETGVEELLQIFAADRAWNDDAARKKLLTVFEALGPADPVTLKGRRRLSSLMFS